MLNLTLERIERQIRNLPVERAFLLDQERGIMWQTTDDLPDGVSFSLEELHSMDGGILTHNHPGGRSLSTDDVLLARMWKLQEIRVVTAKQRFSIKPPEEGWNPTPTEVFLTVLRRELGLLDRQVEDEIARGILTAARADLVYHHRLWERMASHGLVRYAAERW
ncbi:MAG TPA: hypothetical protein VF092_29130 [Longimicrobium sp.]